MPNGRNILSVQALALTLFALNACGGDDSGGSPPPAGPSMTAFSATSDVAGGSSSITLATTGTVGDVWVHMAAWEGSNQASTHLVETIPGVWTATAMLPNTPGLYFPVIDLNDGAETTLAQYMDPGTGTWWSNTTGDTGIASAVFTVTGTVTYPTLSGISATPTTFSSSIDGETTVTFTPSAEAYVIFVGLEDIGSPGTYVTAGEDYTSPIVLPVLAGLTPSTYQLVLVASDIGGNFARYYYNVMNGMTFAVDEYEALTDTTNTTIDSGIDLIPITVN